MSDSNSHSTIGSGSNVPPPGDTSPAAADPRIGLLLQDRYRVVKRIGSGSASIVYQGFDETLRRDVAIKLPQGHRRLSETATLMFLREARILAGLDHPNILPIHDIGRAPDGCYFLVCKLFDTRTLRDRLLEGSLALDLAVRWAIQIADALQHAHERGLIHRDIKPDNILIDDRGQAVVADFELALKQTQLGMGPRLVGTMRYMSPEQARGESHQVDARTDLFSLGVVLYEMLLGKPPFTGSDPAELLLNIRQAEPQSPHHIDPTFPRELEHICLRALAKDIDHRFRSAADFAQQLKLFRRDRLSHPLSADGAAVPAVFRGLDPWTAEDAESYRAWFPGPIEPNGLPRSIALWKQWAEARDPLPKGRLGLLTGPTGSGKTSLVQAGLIPTLADHVLPIYVEAIYGTMKERILTALRSHLPLLPGDLDLLQVLQLLREDPALAQDRKIFVILDRSENWLGQLDDIQIRIWQEIIEHCDGVRIQCLCVVRNDLVAAAHRFCRFVGMEIHEGYNSQMVDVIDRIHARRLLHAIGRAVHALPHGPLSPYQEQFLDEAVALLTPYGRLLPSNLALFVEATRGRDWDSQLLYGGLNALFMPAIDRYLVPRDACRSLIAALMPPPQIPFKRHAVGRRTLCARTSLSEELVESTQDYLDRHHFVTIADSSLVGRTDDLPYYQIAHEYYLPYFQEWLLNAADPAGDGI